ncbi:repetitive organellar protein-like [Centruroides vittatus]|uniref:repetitive organellar protein-like n=1 Tax=Centruroides vittatus TaxID=120091 RepID=UPI00350F55FF
MSKKGQRSQRTTSRQSEMLVNFMEDNPKLMSEKLDASFTVKDRQKLWQEIADRLNSDGVGSQKHPERWRKLRISSQDLSMVELPCLNLQETDFNEPLDPDNVLEEFNSFTEFNLDDLVDLSSFSDVNLDLNNNNVDSSNQNEIYRDVGIPTDCEISSIGSDEINELDLDNTKFNLIDYVCNGNDDDDDDQSSITDFMEEFLKNNEQISKSEYLNGNGKRKYTLHGSDSQLTSQSNITLNALNSVENINYSSKYSELALSSYMKDMTLHEKESKTLHKPIYSKRLENLDMNALLRKRIDDSSDEEVDVITVDEKPITIIQNFKVTIRNFSVKKFEDENKYLGPTMSKSAKKKRQRKQKSKTTNKVKKPPREFLARPQMKRRQNGKKDSRQLQSNERKILSPIICNKKKDQTENIITQNMYKRSENHRITDMCNTFEEKQNKQTCMTEKSHQNKNKQQEEKHQVQANNVQKQSINVASSSQQNEDKLKLSDKKTNGDILLQIPSKLCGKVLRSKNQGKSQINSTENLEGNVSSNMTEIKELSDADKIKWEELIKSCQLGSSKLLLGIDETKLDIYPRTFKNKKFDITNLNQPHIKKELDKVLNLQFSSEQNCNNNYKQKARLSLKSKSDKERLLHSIALDHNYARPFKVGIDSQIKTESTLTNKIKSSEKTKDESSSVNALPKNESIEKENMFKETGFQNHNQKNSHQFCSKKLINITNTNFDAVCEVKENKLQNSVTRNLKPLYFPSKDVNSQALVSFSLKGEQTVEVCKKDMDIKEREKEKDKNMLKTEEDNYKTVAETVTKDPTTINPDQDLLVGHINQDINVINLHIIILIRRAFQVLDLQIDPNQDLLVGHINQDINVINLHIIILIRRAFQVLDLQIDPNQDLLVGHINQDINVINLHIIILIRRAFQVLDLQIDPNQDLLVGHINQDINVINLHIIILIRRAFQVLDLQIDPNQDLLVGHINQDINVINLHIIILIRRAFQVLDLQIDPNQDLLVGHINQDINVINLHIIILIRRAFQVLDLLQIAPLKMIHTIIIKHHIHQGIQGGMKGIIITNAGKVKTVKQLYDFYLV